MRTLLTMLLASLFLVSIGSLLTSFVARQRAEAILGGLQRIDVSLATLDTKVNSIHTNVDLQQQFTLSVIENGDALRDAMDKLETILKPHEPGTLDGVPLGDDDMMQLPGEE